MTLGIRRLRAASVTGLLVAGLAAAPSAQAAEVLDQQFVASTFTYAINSGASLGQTFTAGVTGDLSRVELQIDRALGATTDPLFVEIRNVVAGAPGAVVLAATAVPAASLPVWNNAPAPFLSVGFATSPDVVAGTQYAIVIHNNGVVPNFDAGVSSDGTYAGGSLHRSDNSPPAGWDDQPTYDLAFKTFVEPPAPAPPAPALDPKCDFSGSANGFNVIEGTNGDDVLRGTAGRDLIFGYGGNDVIRGRGGDDVICGGGGKDLLYGGSGDDRIHGGPGNDELYGNRGDDQLRGNGGRDVLRGGFGDDAVNGGPANDDVRS